MSPKHVLPRPRPIRRRVAVALATAALATILLFPTVAASSRE